MSPSTDPQPQRPDAAGKSRPEVSKRATKLARLRYERDVPQRELAEATGLSLRTLKRLELGEIPNPPIRYLANCALALGARLEDVAEDEWLTWSQLAAGQPKRPPKRPLGAD